MRPLSRLLIAACAACGGTDAPTPPAEPVATTLVVSPSVIALTTPGDIVALTVEVLDQYGEPFGSPVPVVPTITSSDDATVRVVEHDLVALQPGESTISVQALGLSVTRQATVGAYPTGPWQVLPNSPTTTGLHFMDATFISSQEGWVVGAPGIVHHTADGGNTWTQRHTQTEGTSQLFRSVAFVSPTTGWAGDLGFTTATSGPALWETTDGGFTWTNIKHRISGPEPVGICGLFAINANTVVGVGRWNGPAVFIKTTDAGASWTSQSLEPLATGAVDVLFFDEMNGLITAGRGVGTPDEAQDTSIVVILGTSDGGATWQQRYAGTKRGQWSWKVSFPTRQVGYVATQGPGGGGVIKTTDGGLTWTELTLPLAAQPGGMWGAGFSTATHGWVSRTHPNDPRDPIHDAWETTDGGLTWSRARWSQGRNVNRYRFLPDGSGYAIGSKVFKLSP